MNIFIDILIGFVTLGFLTVSASTSQENMTIAPPVETREVLASQEFSLRNRYHAESINDIFADNILLALLYLDGDIEKGDTVDWNTVREPGQATFILNPGETFAFHDNLDAKLSKDVVQTTNARFIASEGFKYDGFIVGDGVCHLASFINLLAFEAGLEVYAPVRHDFAKIPDISREFGTSINSGGTTQNLYVTNTTDRPISFIFDHSFDAIKITVELV